MSRVFIFACVLALPSAALADAIDGPPACPPGARGMSSHAGQWCVAAPCASDSECHDGATCRPWRVCVRTIEMPFGGRRAFAADEPRTHPVELVVGTCAPDAACTGLEEPPPPGVRPSLPGQDVPAPTCTDGRYCVPPDLPPLPSLGGGPRAVDPGDEGDEPTAPNPAPTSARSGCGCRTASGAAIPLPMAFAVALLALALRRSR